MTKEKNKMTLLQIIFISSFLTYSCAPTITYEHSSYKNTSVEMEPIFERNYELGASNKVNVGEALIKVKKYRSVSYTSGLMRATNDFIIGGFGGFSEDEDITINNTVKIYHPPNNLPDKGNDYVQLSLTTKIGKKEHTLSFLVDKDGYPYQLGKLLPGKRSNNYDIPLDITPAETRFMHVSENEKHLTYLNYEILYSGVLDQTIRFNYREFTSNDIARPAFYQELYYDKGQEFIQFKDTKIKILNISNENIDFIVIEDGFFGEE